ncbi:MAG TPA: hypothetical protein VGG48_11960 [Rhizomicrobium sp.]
MKTKANGSLKRNEPGYNTPSLTQSATRFNALQLRKNASNREEVGASLLHEPFAAKRKLLTRFEISARIPQAQLQHAL